MNVMAETHDRTEASTRSLIGVAAVMIGVGLATTLIWPPVFEHLAELMAPHA